MLNKLISWSTKHFSDLPWRTNRSIYGTLVSEIMLQQTTVGTVKNHFEKFLIRFPDIQSLAVATEEELLIEWKGLGYYRRARNLKKIANQINEIYNGNFPAEAEKLLKLNGIGPYTANALIGIGMDKRAIAVDANIERVLSRLYGITELKGPKLTKKIYELFQTGEILNGNKLSFRALNEALMDLGRVYCKASTVECQNCPISKMCKAFQTREQLLYPQEVKKKKVAHELTLLRLIIKKNETILVYLKKENEWLGGQWEVPTFLLESTDKKFSQYPSISTKIDLKSSISFKTSITKYKIVNVIKLITNSEFRKIIKDKKYIFKNIERESNFSTATLKALSKLD